MPSDFLGPLLGSHPDKILAAYVADRGAWYDGEGEFIERDMLSDDVMRYQFSSRAAEEGPLCPMGGLVALRALLGCGDDETVREAVERLVARLAVK